MREGQLASDTRKLGDDRRIPPMRTRFYEAPGDRESDQSYVCPYSTRWEEQFACGESEDSRLGGPRSDSEITCHMCSACHHRGVLPYNNLSFPPNFFPISNYNFTPHYTSTSYYSFTFTAIMPLKNGEYPLVRLLNLLLIGFFKIPSLPPPRST